jgi:hypothetical protein
LGSCWAKACPMENVKAKRVIIKISLLIQTSFYGEAKTN